LPVDLCYDDEEEVSYPEKLVYGRQITTTVDGRQEVIDKESSTLQAST